MLLLKYDQPKTLLKRIDEGGWPTKLAPSFIYIIPSTYTGEIIGSLTYFTQGKKLWLRQI